MSQVWLKPKKFSVRSARSIVLYPALSKRLRLLVTIAPKILTTPIGVVWLHAWYWSQQTYFSAQRRHFYLSPLAVQKVTTPLLKYLYGYLLRRGSRPHKRQNMNIFLDGVTLKTDKQQTSSSASSSSLLSPSLSSLSVET